MFQTNIRKLAGMFILALLISVAAFQVTFWKVSFNPPIAKADTDVTNDFHDTNFKNCVLDYLHNPTIMSDAAATIHVLDCTSRHIVLLDGIEHLTGLTNLAITDNDITDAGFAPIANPNVPHLQILGMGQNQVTTLDPLEGKTELQLLHVHCNYLTGAHALDALTSLADTLTDLRIGPGCSTQAGTITDYSAIASLTNLHILHLWQLNLTDAQLADALGSTTFSSMTELRLDNNGSGLTNISSITPTHFPLLATLLADNNTITSGNFLSGTYSHMADLEFSNNSVDDISSITPTHFPLLATLKVKHDGITDGHFLADAIYSHMTDLEFGSDYVTDTGMNSISSISMIKPVNFPNLVTLYGDNNAIVDISPVNGLQHLSNFGFHSNHISQASVQQLIDLPLLTGFDVGDNPDIIDLTFLTNARFPKLTGIWAYMTGIDGTSLDSIKTEFKPSHHPAADFISLELGDDHGISNWSGIGDLTKLTYLALWYDNISDVSFLSTLTQMANLDFHSNSVASLEPLRGLNYLYTVDFFDNNNISDLSPLAGKTTINEIELYGNNIYSISALSGLTNLTILDLHKNHISNVAPLAGLKKLTDLNLKYNNLTSLTPLTGSNLADFASGLTMSTQYNPQLATLTYGPAALIAVGALRSNGANVSHNIGFENCTDTIDNDLGSVIGSGAADGVGAGLTDAADPYCFSPNVYLDLTPGAGHGHNRASCGTIDDPCISPYMGSTLVQGLLFSYPQRDITFIAQGIRTGDVPLSAPEEGSSTIKSITVKNWPPGPGIVQPIINGSVSISGNNVTLDGFEITGDATKGGIMLVSGNPPSNVTIRNNYIHGMAVGAVIAGTNINVYNNIFSNNEGTISVGPPPSIPICGGVFDTGTVNAAILNNTFYDNCTQAQGSMGPLVNGDLTVMGLVPMGMSNPVNTTVKQNLVYNSHTAADTYYYDAGTETLNGSALSGSAIANGDAAVFGASDPHNFIAATDPFSFANQTPPLSMPADYATAKTGFAIFDDSAAPLTPPILSTYQFSGGLLDGSTPNTDFNGNPRPSGSSECGAIEDQVAVTCPSLPTGESCTEVNVNNDAPAFVPITGITDDHSTPDNPTNTGTNITFTATATDTNGDNYYLIICNQDDTAVPHIFGAPTCGRDIICVSSSTQSNHEATCETIPIPDGYPEIGNWHSYVCDYNANSKCSTPAETTNSPAYINHRPEYNSFTANDTDSTPDMTGHTIEPGDTVHFHATLVDYDTETTQDNVRMVVCPATTTAMDGTYAAPKCDGNDPICASTGAAPGAHTCSAPVAPIPTMHGDYNVKVFTIDEHDFAGTDSPAQHYTVTDVAPVIDSFAIFPDTGGQCSVGTAGTCHLTAGDKVTASVTADIHDNNGNTDFTGGAVSGSLYDNDTITPADCKDAQTQIASNTITGVGQKNFGTAMVTGDFNDDGKMDLAISGIRSDWGHVYIFFNYQGSGIPSSTASADVTIQGDWSDNNAQFGSSLAAGDFNNDGKTDLAVGAFTAGGGHTMDFYAGAAYIFFNPYTNGAGGSYPSLSSGADVTITGELPSQFGSSMTAGDFNGDGKTDLAVGASYYNNYQGRAYIFYNTYATGGGSGGPYPSTAATADAIITGTSGQGSFGNTMTAGDLNGDGKTDLIVGEFDYDTGAGGAFIFYNDGSYPASAADADKIIEGEVMSHFGQSMTTGDFNTDGKTDLAVGSLTYMIAPNVYIGRAYIFYNDGSIPTSAADADVIITGQTNALYFGYSMVAGDFNNDSRTDLAIGAMGASALGKAYIFYNDTIPWTNQGTACTTDCLADNADVIMAGQYDMYAQTFGTTLAAGDFDNNGKTDLAMGATYQNDNVGKVYIFSSVDNERDCYTASSSCYFTLGSGTEATATCPFTLWFNTQPSSNWEAYLSVVDNGGNSDSWNSSTHGPSGANGEIVGIRALDIRDNLDAPLSTIDYGSLIPGGNPSSTEVVYVANVGNLPFDTELYGADMCNGACPQADNKTIVVGQQQYSQSTFTYGSGTALKDLAHEECLNDNVAVRDSHSNFSGSNDVFFAITIPSGILSGSYAGTDTFASADDTGSCGTP